MSHGHGHAHGHAGHDHQHGEHSHHANYVKIWAVLVALLIVSYIGPMFGVKALTLFTAFGIAIVKAYLVIKNFMHIDTAARYVTYMVVTTLVFMLLFFAGTAPDVMKAHGGTVDNIVQWTKPSYESYDRNLKEAAAHESEAEHH